MLSQLSLPVLQVNLHLRLKLIHLVYVLLQSLVPRMLVHYVCYLSPWAPELLLFLIDNPQQIFALMLKILALEYFLHIRKCTLCLGGIHSQAQ